MRCRIPRGRRMPQSSRACKSVTNELRQITAPTKAQIKASNDALPPENARSLLSLTDYWENPPFYTRPPTTACIQTTVKPPQNGTAGCRRHKPDSVSQPPQPP